MRSEKRYVLGINACKLKEIFTILDISTREPWRILIHNFTVLFDFMFFTNNFCRFKVYRYLEEKHYSRSRSRVTVGGLCLT